MTKNEILTTFDKAIELVFNANKETDAEIKATLADVKTILQNELQQYCDTYTPLIDEFTPTDNSTSWNEKIVHLTSVLSEIRDMINNNMPCEPTKGNKIFIVHGHNKEIELAVARLISQLGLTPIVLHEQPNKGRTIIEKFEELSNCVSFAIVLLSADDVMQDGKHRARQNVILELGYFIAKLGRENVVALYDTSTEIELPSDIIGVLYKPYDNPNGTWRIEVMRELKEAGFNVDANALT